MPSREDVQAFIVQDLQARFPKARNVALDAETNLIAAGIVDSFGFLDFVGEVEKKFSVQLDLSGYDFEVISTVGGLVAAVVES